MHAQDRPDFEALAKEDADRVDQLSLSALHKQRLTEIYNRWLKILYGEARKQLNLDGPPAHPNAGIEMVASNDVRRIVTVQFGERARKLLFAQIWIEVSGAAFEVRYQYHGYGYPSGASIAF
jgi:hypothetical protein